MKNENDIIYFVTGNIDKFNEILDIYQKEDIKYDLKQLDLEPIEIQANTVKDVASFKLNNIKNKKEGSFFVEDAGFFVDEPLKGFPGVYSSYVFKTIGNEGILRLIDDFNKSKAHFSAAIAFYFKPFDEVFLFEGDIKGKVSEKLRGKGGFGFDPIFIPDIIPDKTFAELSRKEKNQVSHRGQALKKLIAFLKENS